MKKQVYTTIATLGLLLTLAVASTNAQSRTKIEADIPFDFTAGNTNLPAAKYTVRFISHNALLLRSADGKKSAIVITLRAIGSDKDKPERLVFHRYGDRYFLAQVWMLRADSGRELDPSDSENRLAKDMKLAKANSKPEMIEITTAAK